MSNYLGVERSNYVKFKGECLEEVREYLKGFSVNLQEKDGMYCMLPSVFSEDGCFGSINDDGDSLDIRAVAGLMEPGQVLVVLSIGAEKLRYLCGKATAWDHRGNCVDIDLYSIYELASQKFMVPVSEITEASY